MSFDPKPKASQESVEGHVFPESFDSLTQELQRSALRPDAGLRIFSKS